MDFRVGFSKDIHRLVENRKLIIAGVVVPFDKGELAHSDGDVVYHAVAESIFGALALGDLGKRFPDDSSETLDMDSSLIVKSAISEIESKGYEVNNIDVFISLEKPKLKNYIEQMRNNLATLLKVELDQVSVKAGTNEGCGEVGRGEAIEATSIVSLKKR